MKNKGKKKGNPIKYGKKVETWLLNYSKENQEKMTNAEKCFFDYLINNKIPFKSQVPYVGNKAYIFDFLLFKKHIVEIDGGYHFTQEQQEKDSERDKDLKKRGFKITRFTNVDILEYTPKFSKWIEAMASAANSIRLRKKK